jgi:signal peptidase I
MFDNKKIRVVLLFLVFCIIWKTSYKFFTVDGDSMAESLVEGEKVLVDKGYYWFNQPEKGDVVVFYDFESDSYLVKRIIGIPNDIVEIIEGIIFINNIPLDDEFSYMLVKNPEPYIEANVYCNVSAFKVNEGEYWLIGDNREETWMGKIKEEDILGILKQ